MPSRWSHQRLLSCHAEGEAEGEAMQKQAEHPATHGGRRRAHSSCETCTTSGNDPRQAACSRHIIKFRSLSNVAVQAINGRLRLICSVSPASAQRASDPLHASAASAWRPAQAARRAAWLGASPAAAAAAAATAPTRPGPAGSSAGGRTCTTIQLSSRDHPAVCTKRSN